MIDAMALAGVGAASTKTSDRSASVGSAPEGDFSAVLSNLITGTMETVRAGEVAASEGLSGRMALQDVVDRVMTAEQSLQAALAVRDKVVTAYLEISRMSI